MQGSVLSLKKTKKLKPNKQKIINVYFRIQNVSLSQLIQLTYLLKEKNLLSLSMLLEGYLYCGNILV